MISNWLTRIIGKILDKAKQNYAQREKWYYDFKVDWTGYGDDKEPVN